MARLYLALGTNLGDKEKNIEEAVRLIDRQVGRVISQSACYATAPEGFDSTNTFLNCALCVETPLKPLDALNATEEIERTLGRTQKSHNGHYADRIIDIDLLIYDNLRIDSPRLTLPHPRMVERSFVLGPLSEIAPELVATLRSAHK